MLDKRTILLYSNTGVEKHNAAVAQSVERRIGSAEVTGPIPVSSFFCAQKDHKQQIVYFEGRFFITDKRNRAADGRSVFLIHRKLRPMNQKALRAGCASRGEEVSCKQQRSSAKESQATLYLLKIQNLVLFDLFICITGNKMINEKIDRMLLCFNDFSESFILFCQTVDFRFTIHFHLPFCATQIDTGIVYIFMLKKII